MGVIDVQVYSGPFGSKTRERENLHNRGNPHDKNAWRQKSNGIFRQFLFDTAAWTVSSQRMQDHFGAKSANCLAG